MRVAHRGRRGSRVGFGNVDRRNDRHAVLFDERAGPGAPQCPFVRLAGQRDDPGALARGVSDDGLAVGTDLQVLQERPERSDIFGETMVVNQISAVEIESEQARGTQAMVAVVNRPQSIESIHSDAEYGVKQASLRCTIRKGHRSAVDVFQ